MLARMHSYPIFIVSHPVSLCWRTVEDQDEQESHREEGGEVNGDPDQPHPKTFDGAVNQSPVEEKNRDLEKPSPKDKGHLTEP